MAKNTLPTNYQDDILNASMNGKRRYNLIQNTDETVSLEDVTDYDQVGSNFGAGQINAITTAANESADKNRIIDNLSTIKTNTQSGYMAGALAAKALYDEVNGKLGGIVITAEGSGANTKYFAQKGADSASKKPLGESEFVTKTFSTNVSCKYTRNDFSISISGFSRALGVTNTQSTSSSNFTVSVSSVTNSAITGVINVDNEYGTNKVYTVRATVIGIK